MSELLTNPEKITAPVSLAQDAASVVLANSAYILEELHSTTPIEATAEEALAYLVANAVDLQVIFEIPDEVERILDTFRVSAILSGRSDQADLLATHAFQELLAISER